MWKHFFVLCGAISVGILASRYLGSAFSGITNSITAIVPKSGS